MEYNLEQLKEYEELINKTLQTGTIKREDKKKLEDFLFKVTGNKVNCMGCNLTNILNILKAYKKKFDEQATTQTVNPVAQENKEVVKAKAGRPKKQTDNPAEL